MRNNAVEILVMANGYQVGPTRWNDSSNNMKINWNSEYRVFETFEALSKWLNENLETPLDKRSVTQSGLQPEEKK